MDIIDYYKGNPDREFDPFQKIAAAFSCKNAIKAGEQLSQAQMHAIVDQLFACESPYFCPHGRPVIITMDLEEFDRKFKRIT
jgi:DNA mismatch repair protein MutL